MKIDIIGRNYKVSDRLKSLIEKKISKFDKFFEKPATVNSVGIKGHYVCQYCDLTFDKDYLQITDLTIPKLELQTTNSGLSLANAIALYAGLHLIVFVIALVVAKISKKRK